MAVILACGSCKPFILSVLVVLWVVTVTVVASQPRFKILCLLFALIFWSCFLFCLYTGLWSFSYGSCNRDNDLHRLLFMPNGLPDGAYLAYYAKGQVNYSVQLLSNVFSFGFVCIQYCISWFFSFISPFIRRVCSLLWHLFLYRKFLMVTSKGMVLSVVIVNMR